MSLEAKVSTEDDAEINLDPDPTINERSLQKQKSWEVEKQEELQLSDFLTGDGTKVTKINSDMILLSLQTQNYKFLTKVLAVHTMERSVIVNLFMGKSKKHVSQLLSFLAYYTDAYTIQKHGLGFIGEGQDMFHLVKCRNLNNRSLLEHIVHLNMIKQREELLDVLDKIDQSRYPGHRAGSKRRLTEQLKLGLQSSEGLVTCIQALHMRYRWSKAQVRGRQLISVIKNIIFGWTMFFLDMGTDTAFTVDMYWNSFRDCKTEIEDCKMEFISAVKKIPDYCNITATFFKCQKLYDNISLFGHACYSDNKCRFEDPQQWRTMMYVSLGHCIAPILTSCLVYIIVEMGHLHKVYKMPNPCITKFYRMLLEFKLFKMLGKEEFIDGNHRDKMEANENSVVMSMIIEAVVESSFQFYFQTTFLVPVIIVNILNIQNVKLLTDFFNWRVFSISMSFVTISWSFFNIRNTEKKGALSSLTLIILTFKFALEAVSRILIFSSWMLVVYNGKFCPIIALVSYYVGFGVIFLFNILHTTNRQDYNNPIYWIAHCSYNNYNFKAILERGGRSDPVQLHSSTFTRQVLYYLLIVISLLSLTVSTVMNLREGMVLENINGQDYQLSVSTVVVMLILGWSAFFSGLALNLFYYIFHPSQVEISPRGKITTCVWRESI